MTAIKWIGDGGGFFMVVEGVPLSAVLVIRVVNIERCILVCGWHITGERKTVSELFSQSR